jgi:superfamily II DNA or RNA helicase
MITENVNWAQLKKLYEFESFRVSGPGSYKRDLQDTLWTLNDLKSSLHLSDCELKDFEKLISSLLKDKEIMQIHVPDGEDKYLTRVAETVRLLGHNYEYWFRGRPGIDSVRWLVEDKKIPVRDISAERFIDELIEMTNTQLGSGPDTLNLRESIKLVIEGVGYYLQPQDWKKACFSEFQLKATKEMILSQYKPNYKQKTQILIAGVGSGKTIAFSITMLISAVESIRSGEKDRRCHLFLYPRTALAQDQFNTLTKIASKIRMQELLVHFEHYQSHIKNYGSVKKGLEALYGKPGAPPSIIITTLETLNRRLHHPLVITKFASYLERVVLDEIHLIEGIPGCHVLRLMDRLRQACNPKRGSLLWTGSSATVANPDTHVSTVFGIPRSCIKIIEPAEDRMSNAGLVHHIFIRPSGLLSYLGTLVNSSSIIVHNRRDILYNRPERVYSKTIGFCDNLDLIGRWNSDLRENERTESSFFRRHPQSSNLEEWTPIQREVPYALRFVKPLQRRIVYGGLLGYEPLPKILERENWGGICDRCKAGERINLGKLDRENMQKLGFLIYRLPVRHSKKEKIKTFRISNKIFDSDQLSVGTLDLCPFLRAGACFWFSNDDFEPAPIEGSRFYEWRCVARSKVHSSKSKPEAGYEDELSELVFSGSTQQVYDIVGDTSIPIDIVVASPSLEVGVDLPKVTESIMFKAIRNVASYRQKAGRIGRELGSNSMNITLVSLRPIDLHYYRQPKKLISRAQLDPVALKEQNESILKCALYMAGWDFLALKADLPEVIPFYKSNDRESDFSERLRRLKVFIDLNKTEFTYYLSGVSRGLYPPKSMLISNIIQQISDEIDIFLTSTTGTIKNLGVHTIADLMVYMFTSSVKIMPPSSQNIQRVNDGKESYKKLKPNIHTIELGVFEEFSKLDGFQASGWLDVEGIQNVVSSLDKKIVALEQKHESDFAIDNLKEINLYINKIIKGLKGMQAEGINPLVLNFYHQYDKFISQKRSSAYYLSYTLQELSLFDHFKKDPAFVTPPNLFVNPYEAEVPIFRRGNIERTVPVREILFSFIPGTWTFRLGKNANKTHVGKLESSKGEILYAKRNLMEASGNEFELIQRNVPAPPGFPADTLTLYIPKKLTVEERVDKYVKLNMHARTIIDKDEDNYDAAGSDDLTEGENEGNEQFGTRAQIKIPDSFLNRWVYVTADDSERIIVNATDEENLVIEEDNLKGIDARRKILHPMLNGLINSILWHNRLEVCDFVLSASRSYTNRIVNNAVLMFQDEDGYMAFGHRYCTEGVSIELDSNSLQNAVSQIKKSMLSFNNIWAPSLVKAFRAILCSIKIDGIAISPFMINDLLGVLVTASTSLDSKAIITLPETLMQLLEDESRFKEAARLFYEGKSLTTSNEKETESPLSQQESKDIENQINLLIKIAKSVSNEDIDISNKLEDWINQTLLNTMGITSLTALQHLCGSQEDDIGYTIDLEGLKKQRFRIFLYDRTENGNGSCEVLRRYMHIMDIQRHRLNDESRLLPSEDFLTLLEQELLQCSQFHTDMDALEKLAQKQSHNLPYGLPELGYIGEFSQEILDVCEETWLKLGINSRNDAWRLPLIALAPGSFARKYNLEIDDVIRASMICWNGCPECVVNNSALIGYLGVAFVDKAILDEWFKISRSQTEEYKTLKVKELATGQSHIEIGRQTRAYIALADRRIRSISLPFTIGFELDRNNKMVNADLIVRDGDIHDLRKFPEKFDGTAHGVESLGFRRIMWYNLITCAYLDNLDLIEKNQKEINLVFYDCRDIDFEDIGLSNRMLEAIEYYRKKTGLVGEIQNLSDILYWLAIRGFRISICVDEKRSREDDVKSFLERLAAQNLANISLNVKGLPGSMHKKALITPIGVIYGSANLTYSGTQLSEEIISYAPSGTREYDEMKLSIMDTFYGSTQFRI